MGIINNPHTGIQPLHHQAYIYPVHPGETGVRNGSIASSFLLLHGAESTHGAYVLFLKDLFLKDLL